MESAIKITTNYQKSVGNFLPIMDEKGHFGAFFLFFAKDKTKDGENVWNNFLELWTKCKWNVNELCKTTKRGERNLWKIDKYIYFLQKKKKMYCKIIQYDIDWNYEND